LNDAAKGFLVGFERGSQVFASRGISAYAPSNQQMLAMKLGAWRDDIDVNDAQVLLKQIEGTKEEVWDLVTPFVMPGRELKARYAFDDLWGSRSDS